MIEINQRALGNYRARITEIDADIAPLKTELGKLYEMAYPDNSVKMRMTALEGQIRTLEDMKLGAADTLREAIREDLAESAEEIGRRYIRLAEEISELYVNLTAIDAVMRGGLRAAAGALHQAWIANPAFLPCAGSLRAFEGKGTPTRSGVGFPAIMDGTRLIKQAHEDAAKLRNELNEAAGVERLFK